MRYLVVVEKGPESFGAYVPDLPGYVAAAETREEVVALIREAIEFHIEGLGDVGCAGCASERQLPRLIVGEPGRHRTAAS